MQLEKNYGLSVDYQASIRQSKKMPLVAWFAIAYSMPVVGGLWGRYKNAKSWSQISGEPQILIVFDEVMNPAGLIDTFVFPSLASALTITSSIFFYRKVAIKLKQKSRKPLLVITFVAATMAIWISLSIALALALS